MEGLPPTSDIKMIDMWLVMGQLVPFVEVIIATFIELYREEPKKEDANEDEMNMSMILADLYVAKMDSKMDIPEEKTEEKKDESVDVGVGSRKSSFWNSLREKHNNEGLIVPHLHFIGDHSNDLIKDLLICCFRGKDHPWHCGDLLHHLLCHCLRVL